MKRLFISAVLCVSALFPLHAMDCDMDDDVRFEIDEPMFVEKKPVTKGIGWNTLLDRITKDYCPIEEMSPQNANKWALEVVAKLSFDNAVARLNRAFSQEECLKLLAYKNTKSDPYILFIYLLPEIRQRVLWHLKLTSETDQKICLDRNTREAFIYATYKESQSSLPFKLYYPLSTHAQIQFIEDIFCNKKTTFSKREIPRLPAAVLKDSLYTTIMAKKISVTKEVLWKHGVKLEKQIATVKDLCAPLRAQVAPIGTDSPTILSRVKTLFRPDDCTS
jgi:hypothetical protein